MRSINRESGLVAWATQHLAMVSVKTYLKLYHRFTVRGLENLPRRPPYVLVANHTSHLDSLCLAATVRRKYRNCVFPIAAGDTFFESPPRAWLTAMTLNALPMWRRHCGPHALKDLRQRLTTTPTIYILFPEGTRSRDGCLGPFKAGLGMLIAETDVPVMPCYLRGAYAALAPHRRVPRPRRLSLSIGKPMNFSGVQNRHAGWNRIATDLRQAVADLAGDIVLRDDQVVDESIY
ncbi:MAG: lysophospholipid acyltransferase family protein [Planctomycetota bacterium]